MSGYVSTDDGRMVRVRSLGPHTTIGGNGPDDGPQWRSRRPTAWLRMQADAKRSRAGKFAGIREINREFGRIEPTHRDLRL